MPGIDLIYDITEIFQMHNIETEIIAASVRNPIHVIDCAKAGADIATVPYKVIEQMTKHPLTDQGIEKFRLITGLYSGNKKRLTGQRNVTQEICLRPIPSFIIVHILCGFCRGLYQFLHRNPMKHLMPQSQAPLYSIL